MRLDRSLVTASIGAVVLVSSAFAVVPPPRGAPSEPAGAADPSPARGGLVGVGRPAAPSADRPCITPRTRAGIEARLAGLRGGPAAPAGADGAPQPYTFFPMGGRQYGDVFTGIFADVEPATPGFLDFACGPHSYDFHGGHDSAMRSFGEQAIGMPVFAALDGTVLFAVDGFPDMNLNGSFDAGNYVILDHGDGHETWYFHLKNGSVAVGVGNPVVAGQQIGSAASSGNSFGPHLHFETQVGGSYVEPNAGACNAIPSLWTEQVPLVLDNYVWDFGVSRTDAFASPLTIFPYEPIKDPQIALSDPEVFFWVRVANLPAMATWTVRWYRPDDSLAFDGIPVGFFNPELWREAWFGWAYDIADMHTIPGTWRLEFDIDGIKVIDAPVEVVATIDPAFNRPPGPVAVSLHPAEPIAGDVIVCEVDADLVLDDLDWDVVRWRYVWNVQGATVRDVTVACQSDALRSDAALPGERVTCTVTPSDGKPGGDGTPASATTVVGPSPWTDLGFAYAGLHGDPVQTATGSLLGGEPLQVALGNARENAAAFLFVGLDDIVFFPFYGGTLVPDPNPPGLLIILFTDAAGTYALNANWPPAIPSGFSLWLQTWIDDPAAPYGYAGSNAVKGVSP